MSRPTPKMSFVVGTDFDRTWQTPNADGTVGNVFVATDTIGSRLWVGDAEIVLATPTVVWGSDSITAEIGAGKSLWTIQFQATDTAAIAAGRYRLQVFAIHAGRTAVLWNGLVDLADTAGSATTADLITLTYAESAIVRTRLAPMSGISCHRSSPWPATRSGSGAGSATSPARSTPRSTSPSSTATWPSASTRSTTSPGSAATPTPCSRSRPTRRYSSRPGSITRPRATGTPARWPTRG